MSDKGFPVQHVSIVGWNVRIEEQVTGRLTKWRAAGYGAISGAWSGVLIGLLLALFAPGVLWLWLLLWGLAFGALWGAVFGFVGHWALRGRRDFGSVQRLAAQRWDVMVEADLIDRARSELASDTSARPTPPPQQR